MPPPLSATNPHEAEAATEIASSISDARLSSYYPPLIEPLADELPMSAALRLYQWNAEVTAAIWPVMHIFEVTVRNAISEAIARVHGEDWAHDRSFQLKLKTTRIKPGGNTHRPYDPRRDLEKHAERFDTTGKVIPELKMVFWERMLVKHHDGNFWRAYLTEVFPYLPEATLEENRNQLRRIFERARSLRNRLGHHEPICDPSKYDLEGTFSDMMSVLSWRSPEVHAWVDGFEQFQSVLLCRPQAPGSSWVAE